MTSFEIFDREAARYDAWFDSERGRALFESELRCLRRVSEGLPRPWLEVGVGTGRFAEALGIDVGVDPASGALQYAERRGVCVLPGVGQALPFEDMGFGAVFVIVTLCFADDPVGLLREARRVVKDGGGVVLGIVPAGGPWGRLYAAKAKSGHAFYSEARFFTLTELERLAREAGLIFGQATSTLFQSPSDGPFEVEAPRDGTDAGAGFVAVLCRPQAETNNDRDDDLSTGDSDGREPEPLVCVKDNVEVDRESPRCPYPSSRCRFREWCRVIGAVRATRRSSRTGGETCVRRPDRDGPIERK